MLRSPTVSEPSKSPFDLPSRHRHHYPSSPGWVLYKGPRTTTGHPRSPHLRTLHTRLHLLCPTDGSRGMRRYKGSTEHHRLPTRKPFTWSRKLFDRFGTKGVPGPREGRGSPRGRGNVLGSESPFTPVTDSHAVGRVGVYGTGSSGSWTEDPPFPWRDGGGSSPGL